MKHLSCIMLIDDNPDDNFFHEREIVKWNPNEIVVVRNSGQTALDYLKSSTKPQSDLIFLDINMPGMNGWEFLSAYDKLNPNLKSDAIIIMLTTSDSEIDRLKAKSYPFVTAFVTKPLTREKIKKIDEDYF